MVRRRGRYTQPVNTLFRIAFGDYEFVLDRTNLTYSLTETVTKTVWATALSLGWIELKDRATGTITRTDFGDCKLISIAEKMGAAGKRILLGLDAPGGVPIDIYLICGSKEIQLTVEASRDSKTHLLERVGLLPGLCRAEPGGYLVIPQHEGRILKFDEYKAPTELPVWDASVGLSMPFIGAVQPHSALALITDSAYASAHLTREQEEHVLLDWVYARDPERRRLDIRLVVLPKGDHIAIARAYRDKLIGERNHTTLRKKIRERPELAEALDAFWAEKITTEEFLRDFGVPKIASSSHDIYARRLPNKPYWEAMEKQLEALEVISKEPGLILAGGNPDWLAPFADAWSSAVSTQKASFMGRPVPLQAVVYHDSVVCLSWIGWSEQSRHPSWPQTFLRALLTLSTPTTNLFRLEKPGAEQFDPEGKGEQYCAIAAVLCPLNALTFPAFLTAHKFLTPDFLVEEALYSDKTRVVINQSETEPYDARVSFCSRLAGSTSATRSLKPTTRSGSEQ